MDQDKPVEATARAAPPRAWEAISVAVATIVGLLSLAVSAYTAYTLRVQTRAQVYPYLQVEFSPNARLMSVHNKGVGPAFVGSVQITVDGKPVLDWGAFFRAAGLKTQGTSTSSTLNGGAIAANENVDVLAFEKAEDFAAFASIDPRRYHYRICYCSVLKECWTIHSEADGNSVPAEEARCQGDAATEFKR